MRTGFYLTAILAIVGFGWQQSYALATTSEEITAHFVGPMNVTALLLGVTVLTSLVALFSSRHENACLAIVAAVAFIAIFVEIAAVTFAAPYQPQMSAELLAFMRFEVAFTILLLVSAGTRLMYLAISKEMSPE